LARVKVAQGREMVQVFEAGGADYSTACAYIPSINLAETDLQRRGEAGKKGKGL